MCPAWARHERLPLALAWGATFLTQLARVAAKQEPQLSCFSAPAGPGSDDRDAAAVRANHPVPSDCPVYYFEVEITSRGRDGFIGGRQAKGAGRQACLPPGMRRCQCQNAVQARWLGRAAEGNTQAAAGTRCSTAHPFWCVLALPAWGSLPQALASPLPKSSWTVCPAGSHTPMATMETMATPSAGAARAAPTDQSTQQARRARARTGTMSRKGGAGACTFRDLGVPDLAGRWGGVCASECARSGTRAGSLLRSGVQASRARCPHWKLDSGRS